MAFKGKQFKFHGSFTHKTDAINRERRGRKRFIREITVKGKKRYMVLERVK